MAKDTNEEIIHTLADMNEAIGGRFDQVDENVGELRGDMNRLDKNIGEVRSDVNRLDKNIGEVRSDMNLLENSMNNQFTEVREQLDRIEHTILEEHARRIEALERKIGLTQ